MTSDRAQAYGRVAQTLREVGPSKLLPAEQELVREAADALFFCEDLGQDQAARTLLAQSRELAGNLVESDRWLEDTARELLDDLQGCGPLLPVPAAATS